MKSILTRLGLWPKAAADRIAELEAELDDAAATIVAIDDDLSGQIAAVTTLTKKSAQAYATAVQTIACLLMKAGGSVVISNDIIEANSGSNIEIEYQTVEDGMKMTLIVKPIGE